MAMFFKCRSCGNEHLSSIQMPKATFESPTTVISRSPAVCPTTGRVVRVDKAEVYWKDSFKVSA